MNTQPNQNSDRDLEFLRLREVCSDCDRSPASIYRDMKAGRFPKPLKTGPNSVRWTRGMIREHKERLLKEALETAA